MIYHYYVFKNFYLSTSIGLIKHFKNSFFYAFNDLYNIFTAGYLTFKLKGLLSIWVLSYI